MSSEVIKLRDSCDESHDDYESPNDDNGADDDNDD